jgi:hypothetical protein
MPVSNLDCNDAEDLFEFCCQHTGMLPDFQVDAGILKIIFFDIWFMSNVCISVETKLF